MTQKIEQFLTPISDEHPCGADLRYEKIYDDIKQARFAEDATLPQGVWVRDKAESQWDVVDDLCREALLRQSKDVQLACWLMEAWYHRYGIPGLIDGLKLSLALCETYWLQLHPGLETGFRLSPFHWINEKFSTQLLNLPLEQKNDAKVYTFSDYKRVKMSQGKTKETTFNDLILQLKKTPATFFETLADQCQEALDVSEKLENFVERNLTDEEISLYRLRQNLEELVTLSRSFIPKEEPLEVKVEIEEHPEVQSANDLSLEPCIAVSSLGNRQTAYQRIAEIADYLQKIEPHSPTPYLLRKALVWGEMGLQELVQEFIKSGMNLQQIQSWIGVAPTQPGPPADQAGNKS